MKKLLILFSLILFVFGCENIKNTPTAKVENFLGKYQKLDSSIEKELENIIENDQTLNKKEKEEYQLLLEKQYQNLSYKINREEIDNNTAIVEVEIEVLDYKTPIEKENSINEKLKEMKSVTTTLKYPLTFYLEKKEGKWYLEDLSESDLEKIHGMY